MVPSCRSRRVYRTSPGLWVPRRTVPGAGTQGAASGCERGPRARPRLPPPAQVWGRVPRGPGRRRVDLRIRGLLRGDGVDEAAIVSRARASLRLGEALPIVGASGIVGARRSGRHGVEFPPTRRVGRPACPWRRPSDWPSRADSTVSPSPFGSPSSRDAWRCASALTNCCESNSLDGVERCDGGGGPMRLRLRLVTSRPGSRSPRASPSGSPRAPPSFGTRPAGRFASVFTTR